MSEDRLTISSSARLHPDEVARHTFGTARRGFDPAEVRTYLETVAREMIAAVDREHELRRAVAEAERRAANPVLDEATLTAALGQEMARVLRSAHDASAELQARAEGEAAQIRAQAQEEADQLRARTEQSANDRTAQAEAAAAELRRRAQEDAASKLESAKLEAEALAAQTRAECRAMVQEAQELRARVLADFTRRRRVLHSQIEQLRAGRERLAETIGAVRHAVDHITDELFRAEDEARLAAEEAGRQIAAQEELGALDGEAGALPAVEVAPAETAGEAEPDAIRTQAVEELFARLRAERRTESPSGHQPAVNGATVAVAASDGGGDADASSPADAAESPVPGATAPANGPPAPADPFLARRDEALGPVVIALARRVKRALQDDQNDILDRLRAKGGWVAGVLLPEDEHARRYVKASLDSLQEAARAGATLAGGKAEDSGTIDAIAEELASGIVGPLRRRLDSEGPSVEDGDDAALVELVGAAYREWKGARVERLAGDQTVAAFSQGALAAIPAGTALRWVVDDDGAECPDCDDNALAGSLPAGESFPTGHRHPPAHAGCRCLLAPLNA